jgi:GntR family transcriptional repressor for pyruvate dehydrogenase complex
MAAPLAESFRMSTRGRTLRGQTHEATLAAHRAILDCVRRGDGRAAAQAMQAHLKDAAQDLQAALAHRQDGGAGTGAA